MMSSHLQKRQLSFKHLSDLLRLQDPRLRVVVVVQPKINRNYQRYHLLPFWVWSTSLCPFPLLCSYRHNFIFEIRNRERSRHHLSLDSPQSKRVLCCQSRIRKLCLELPRCCSPQCAVLKDWQPQWKDCTQKWRGLIRTQQSQHLLHLRLFNSFQFTN